MTTVDRSFTCGRLVATPGALDAFARNVIGPVFLHLLARHMGGDWGDVSPDDARENEYALQHGLRLLSAYALADGTRVWIVAEADRSATTVPLPEEY